MSVKYLFSPQGRVPRQTFWLANLGWAAAIFLLPLAIGLVMVFGFGADENNPAFIALGMLILPLLCLCGWSSITFGIRRYHDLGKPGVWVLVLFVPVIGHLWYFVETGFFRGTAGPNAFGPDPLAGRHGAAPLPSAA